MSMSSTKWGHVPGIENPADVASRGIMPSGMNAYQLWWAGPAWLRSERQDWPKQHPLKVDEKLLEKRGEEVRCQIAQERQMFELAKKFSCWRQLLRVTAYCRRMVPKNRRSTKVLAADEIEAARRVWLRLVQEFEFGNVKKFVQNQHTIRQQGLQKLQPFVDEHGIMRIGGRLGHATLAYEQQHPTIITGKTAIGWLIIKDAHERVCHGGPQSTLGQINQRYWMMNGRRQVRAMVHRCVICAKARPKPQQQLMGQLPTARVTPSRAFTHTGIDYAGPIWSRTSKGRGQKATKSWVAVFVCFSTKAVHLELVSDVTATAFIAAFKRFTSRRGHCSDVYCDNGTNFVGADREMRRQLQQAMVNEEWRAILGNNGTTFHFVPPGSPHFNGLAEAAVKMAKSAMIKVIGESKLTFEEMSTVLTQIEAALNSRPLYATSSDGNDDSAITPGHFLIGQPITAIPEPNMLNHPPSANRWQLIQQMTQGFWKRWNREYLHHLQQRNKWATTKSNLKVGDVVVLHDESFKNNWRIGRIVETYPGADGHVRVAAIKTGSGVLKRAVVKLSKLPVDST